MGETANPILGDVVAGKFYRRCSHYYGATRYVHSIDGKFVNYIGLDRMQAKRVRLTTFSETFQYLVPPSVPPKPYAHVITSGAQSVWHTYKQSFPMEFWYSLNSHTLFAELGDLDDFFDIRELPQRYLSGLQISSHFSDVTAVGVSGFIAPLDLMQRQHAAHCAAIGRALGDGFDIRKHQAECFDRDRQKEALRRARVSPIPAPTHCGNDDDDDLPF